MSDTATTPPAADPAATTPPATSSPSIFSNGLEFAADWYKALPEEFHGLAKDAKSLPDVFGRMKGLRDEVASRPAGLKVPGEKATDDERATFQKELFKHLGVPETSDAYELNPPEGMEADKELIGLVAKLGPEIGLSKTAASKLAEAYNGHMQARVAAIREESAAARQAEHAALAKELGDNADGAVAIAKNAAKKFGWPEESMDPTNENFVGADAFKLIYGMAAELAKANGTDRTGGDGNAGSRARDWDWAVRVQQGIEPESEYIKDRAHPKYAETWAMIDAAGRAKFPGQR